MVLVVKCMQFFDNVQFQSSVCQNVIIKERSCGVASNVCVFNYKLAFNCYQVLPPRYFLLLQVVSSKKIVREQQIVAKTRKLSPKHHNFLETSKFQNSENAQRKDSLFLIKTSSVPLMQRIMTQIRVLSEHNQSSIRLIMSGT